MDTTEVKYPMHNERVTLEQVTRLALIRGFKDDHNAAVIRKRTAHNHYAILQQRIHERRVFSPVRLFPAGFACYPGSTGSKNDDKRLFQAFHAFHLMVKAHFHAKLPALPLPSVQS